MAQVCFLGDVFLDRQYKIELPCENIIFNLEHPISQRGLPKKGKLCLKQDRSFVRETFGSSLLVACLSNNHIMDYGEDAFLDTLSVLKEQGVAFFGAGHRKDNYNNPHVLNLDGTRLGLLGYCASNTNPGHGKDDSMGCALLALDQIKTDILETKKNVDLIAVYLHWGQELAHIPNPSDVKLAHAIIDTGADIVLGTHTHTMQSAETYKGRKIFYGLGNYIFPESFDAYAFDNTGNIIKTPVRHAVDSHESLSVRWDLRDCSVIMYRSVFDGATSTTRKMTQRYDSVSSSSCMYKFHLWFQYKKHSLRMFMRNPRIPSLKDIRTFFGG